MDPRDDPEVRELTRSISAGIAAERKPAEMSDAELDEAVARECLGWTLDTALMVHGCSLVPLFVESSSGRFTPTSDARDAERVWDWLLAKCGYMEMTQVVRSDAHVTAGNGLARASVYVVGDRKRALCLAALAVARRKP